MKKGLKWIIAFIGAAIFVLLLRCFAFTSYYIPSSGMEDSLLRGDRILVNKWSYGLRSPLLRHLPYIRWKEKPMEREDIAVFNNPANTSDIIDEKEIFISRCIALPGDTLIVDSVFTRLSPNILPDLEQEYEFFYPMEKDSILNELLLSQHITTDTVIEIDSVYLSRTLSWKIYHEQEVNMGNEAWLIPVDKETPSRIHSLVVPSKGQTIKVYPWNRTLLMNTILLHEGHDASIVNDTLFIDGVVSDEYTFTKDYYWMLSNNSINPADSRLFGFVPHDHLIGKASYIWFSKEPRTSFLLGYRWDRFFNKIQ